MGRRLLPLMVAAALAGLACREPPPSPSPAGVAAGDAGAMSTITARPPAAEPDAGDEPMAEPVRPGDVLSGAAAEQVIAETVAPREAPPKDAPELRITPNGIGPFVIGMSRREVASRLGRRGRIVKLWTPPGEVGLEVGELRLAGGTPLLRMRIYGGRLTEISVTARDPRARTDGDIAVGSSFDEAELAHGDPRKNPRGFVLQDLPGVIFVPTATALGAAIPPPPTRIVGIVVVGPESD